MNKKEIIDILTLNKLSPQKQKGQNFLINTELSQKIVGLLSRDHTAVLEIGPGLGALTNELVKKPFKLTTVELDRGFAHYLQKTYPDIEIIVGNILKINVPRETTAVISNLPYYITTKIIEYIVIEQPHVTEFVFMTESDVINRLFAREQTKAYGPLSIVFSLAGTLTKCFDVDKRNFYPMPHVDSTVFKFVRANKELDIKLFSRFLKEAFMLRRKTLLNNFNDQNKANKIKAFFAEFAIKENVRAEELTPETLYTLYLALNDKEREQV